MLLSSRSDGAGHQLRAAQLPLPIPAPERISVRGHRLLATSGIEIDDSIGSNCEGCDASAARSKRSHGPSILVGLKCRMRRRSCTRMSKPNKTRKVAVGVDRNQVLDVVVQESPPGR